MAIGDRPKSGVYQTGTENGCKWGSDGHLYNANGYQIESLAEKKARLRKEQAAYDARLRKEQAAHDARLRKEQAAYDARQKPSGYSYGGIDSIGTIQDEIPPTFKKPSLVVSLFFILTAIIAGGSASKRLRRDIDNF